MLTSQARRRLAQKTSSALGLVGTFVLFAGSLVVGSAPASASALVVEKSYTYSCQQGGPFTNTSITVKLSAPDSATAGSSLNLSVGIPALTLADAATSATKVSATATLTVTGGTVTPGAKEGADIAQGARTAPAKEVIYPVAVTAGATGNVSIKPGNLTLALASAPTTMTTCTAPAGAEALEVPIGTGNGGGQDDVVTYSCTVGTGTETANVDVKVTMTMPTNARTNQDATISWTGAVQTTGDDLTVPTTGFPAGTKFFASIKASGGGVPATATGEATMTGTAGQNLTTLPNVSIKVKPTTAGTVTVTPGDLAIGTTATAATIKCTAPTTGLKNYTFQVTAGTTSPSPSPSNTSPTPTRTTTVIVTETPDEPETTPPTRSSKTPKDGVATGAGGMAGPDGRMFLLAGSALILAAGGGGLLMRRRAARG